MQRKIQNLEKTGELLVDQVFEELMWFLLSVLIRSVLEKVLSGVYRFVVEVVLYGTIFLQTLHYCVVVSIQVKWLQVLLQISMLPSMCDCV